MSSRDAKLKPERTDSDKPSTLTVPSIPDGMDSLSFTVTATPHDASVEDPGGRLDGFGGNRDDMPGTGVTITVKVIKIDSCPTKVEIIRQDSPIRFPDFWNNVYPKLKLVGLLSSRLEVSGGTPPDPPKNWNGLFVREDVQPDPKDPGDAVDGDFDGVTAKSYVTGSSDGFVVGVAGPDQFGFGFPAGDNTFWDFMAAFADRLVFKEGADKTVRGLQTYSCKDKLLTPKFVITTKFHNGSFTYMGSAVRVVEVTCTHGPASP